MCSGRAPSQASTATMLRNALRDLLDEIVALELAVRVPADLAGE